MCGLLSALCLFKAVSEHMLTGFLDTGLGVVAGGLHIRGLSWI